MYYKSSNTIGIRNKTTDTQIGSFGGKKCSKSKDDLQIIGGKALYLLDHGMTEQKAIEWARGYAKKEIF